MLKTVDLISRFDLIDREKYANMIRQVNIPDFTKCIAQFSGLKIKDIDDELIARYLMTWAKNKYRFYKLLGNKIKVDDPFKYKKFREDITSEIELLYPKFPTYYHWLRMFIRAKKNIIEMNDFCGYPYYTSRKDFLDLFPDTKLDGMKITHFFQKYLNAPDALTTAIAAIFENDEIEAMHTISIDPVDMMLASETPYNWDSCYRLELGIDSSHADGCLASVLDNSNIITYVWNKEGKYSLYNNYTFKSIRYKIMRRWIAISPDFTGLHFNSIYPYKDSISEELNKNLRNIIEEKVANYLERPNQWVRDYKSDCSREYCYGYNEYDNDNIFVLKDIDGNVNSIGWTVFNERILCPKHYATNMYLYGVGGDEEYDEYHYNGNGFISDNITQGYWCELRDGWCPYGYYDCDSCNEYECDCWRLEHPVCNLDNEPCEDPCWDYANDGVMDANEEHCSNCPRWKACYESEEQESVS